MYAAMGDVHRNYVNILSMLLCLRQACDDPSLVKDHLKDGESRTQIELLSREEQHFLISRLKSNSDVCSICMVRTDAFHFGFSIFVFIFCVYITIIKVLIF